jgi:recombination associated protein RdgC
MFKQLTIFKLTGVSPSVNSIEAALLPHAFLPIGATQQRSVGFVPPRGFDNGPLIETVGDQRILSVAIETKSVPASIVQTKADEVFAQIEENTGRKPGKKERREIKDAVLLGLLPTAFPKKVHVPIWFDMDNHLVVIGSTSQSKVDAASMLLVTAIEGLNLAILQTTSSPQSAMTSWLLAESPNDWPDNLNIERECVLHSFGEDDATVKFSKHHLANDEVRKHVCEGKLPTSLAISWDGRMSFVLTDNLTFKKVQFLDGVMDGGEAGEDRFDSDVALATGLIGPMLGDVIYALGGELTQNQSSSTN